MDIDFIRKVLLLTLFILFLVVFYKWLMRYLHRNEIQQKFAYLHPYALYPITGVVDLTVELPSKGLVRFELASEGRQPVVIFEGNLPAGTHKISFNSSPFSSGTYQLNVALSNQRITRKMQIRHSA